MALLLVIPPVAFVASSLMIDGMIVALSACMVAAIAAVAEGQTFDFSSAHCGFGGAGVGLGV